MRTITRILAVVALAFSTWVSAAIDINAADAKTLEKLPQIGPAKAQAIVEYRTEKGPFKSPEDLKKVPGIGDKTFDAIKAEISVGDKAPK